MEIPLNHRCLASLFNYSLHNSSPAFYLMSGGKCNLVYSRRCEESLTNIDSLPGELVFDILLHLPAQDIYNGASLVCKKWYKMTRTRRFRYEQFRNSTCGLIVQCSGDENPDFLTVRKGRVEISKLSYKFPGIIWTSCDDLVLGFDSKKCKSPLYVLNPAAKRRFDLPPFICQWEKNHYHSGIAYAAASMEYKVVRSYYCDDGSSCGFQCAISTVGVDKSWRHVDSKHLSLLARKLLKGTPLTTEGCFHRTRSKGTRVLTLKVETEIITETRVPNGYGERVTYYLPTGSSLTLLVACSEFSWEVWELKNGIGGLTNRPKIDLETRKREIKWFVGECYCSYRRQHISLRLDPVCGLNEEVLVLNVVYPSRVCVVYNIRTREIDFYELDYDFTHYRFKVHRNRI